VQRSQDTDLKSGDMLAIAERWEAWVTRLNIARGEQERGPAIRDTREDGLA
jgi:hypothetical protein